VPGAWPGTAPHDDTGFSPRQRQRALAVVALAFVMDLLDVTIVNVAMPAIRDGLGAGAAAVQWMVAGYTLAFAALLVSGGRLGDLLGHRRCFELGVAGFTLASLLCGLASSPATLVAARVAQGSLAALMVPQVMALMQLLYPPAQRVKVFALFGLLGGLSAALGPIVGGLLIQADGWGLGWRLCFLINLPVGLFSLLAGRRWLPARRSGAPAGRLDWPGMLLVTGTLLALVLPLIQGPEQGWPAWCLGLLASTPLLAGGCVVYLRQRQARSGDALLPPALLGLAGFRQALLCSLLLHGVVPGYLLVLSFVLQTGLGYSPLQMALACLPIALGAMASISWLGQRLIQRWRQRTVLAGAVLQALAVLLFAAVAAAARPPATLLLLAQACMGLGLGLVGPALASVMLQDVPTAHAGAASGLGSMVQQLAGVLAVAAVGGVFFARLGAAPEAATSTVQAGLMALPVLLLWLAAGAVLGLRLPVLRLASR